MSFDFIDCCIWVCKYLNLNKLCGRWLLLVFSDLIKGRGLLYSCIGNMYFYVF